jgi:hypothetical protein
VEKQTEKLLKSAKTLSKKMISRQVQNQAASLSDLLKVRGVCLYDPKYVFLPNEVVDY